MEHRQLVEKISHKTGINQEDCNLVLNALEDVLEEDLASSKNIGSAADKIYNIIGYFRNKKRDKDE